MSFKKIDREFAITDSTVNMYGFRLMTDGFVLPEFQKNPIGYHLHADPELTEYGRKDGVLVKWEDIRTEGDTVWAKPCINLSHPRGQRTAEEVENGFLNGASLAQFVVLEMETEGPKILPGQTGPTVTKWYARECSLVDVTGNYNAVAPLFAKALYAKAGEAEKEINLADFKISFKNDTMKVINFTTAQLASLNVAADAEQPAVEAAFNALVQKAAKADQLQVQLTAVNTEVIALKKQVNESTIKSLTDAALAGKKITKLAADKLAADYAENPEGLKALYDAMPAYQSVSDKIKDADDANATELTALAAKDYATLDKEGKLERLMALSMDTFKEKFKVAYGKDWGSK